MKSFYNTIKQSYPTKLFQLLVQIAGRNGDQIYMVGGTVRDTVLGIPSHDLDVAVADHAVEFAKRLIKELGYGTFVDLCGPEDEAARVVLKGVQVDIAAFREGAGTIEEDLRLRDFTINAMAVPLSQLVDGEAAVELIDPTGGMEDLEAGRIRHCSQAFVADPVRMLRGYRLCAILGFRMEDETVQAIKKYRSLIGHVAVERTGYELQLIFDSARTTETVRAMGETGLLRELLPELYKGEGLEQPEFHHLDVLNHSFQALEMMEKIIAEPELYFPGMATEIHSYLKKRNNVRCLKWAALMHDIGKPKTRKEPEEKDGRITFYRHDEEGRQIFNHFADYMRWSKAEKDVSGELIAMHMHPFHLCNVQREKPITKRAALKLCRRAESDLVGLFMLAMSDSLASKGEKKPEKMEEELLQLFSSVMKIYDENIKPVLQGPRLLTGNDLINEFSIPPGPQFSVIQDELEAARVEGDVVDRESAVAWVEEYLQEKKRFGG